MEFSRSKLARVAVGDDLTNPEVKDGHRDRDEDDGKHPKAKQKDRDKNRERVDRRLYYFEDDHQSPISPEGYIQMRLLHMQEFYQRRIPIYARWSQVFKYIMLLCTGTTPLLAYLNENVSVAILTSFSSAALAWSEFQDYRRKIERYSKAVASLKDLLSWWDSRSHIEQNGPQCIKRLVYESERIISGENLAWVKTKPQEKAATEDTKEKDDGGKKVQKVISRT